MTRPTTKATSQSKGVGRSTPRDRAPNEALPNTISIHALPVYVPPRNEPMRRGADDHKAIQSRVYPT